MSDMKHNKADWVRGMALQLCKDGKRLGIMRSLEATQTSDWLLKLAVYLNYEANKFDNPERDQAYSEEDANINKELFENVKVKP